MMYLLSVPLGFFIGQGTPPLPQRWQASQSALNHYANYVTAHLLKVIQMEHCT